MNILGHTGLTVAAIFAAGYLVDTLPTGQHGEGSPRPHGWRNVATGYHGIPRCVQRLGIDHRVILFGSLLPDIIDKPLGFWIFPELVNHSTRSIGHTLVFNMGLLAIGLLILALARSWRPLLLALGSSGHLVLDAMWQVPVRLLWPLYGWSFPPGSTSLEEYLSFQYSGELLGPSELLGGASLLWFGFQLYRQRSVLQFLRVGAIG